MRVLYITNYGTMYGANHSLLNLMIDMRSRYNIEPFVLMPYGGDIEEVLKKNSIQYKVLKHYIWQYEVKKKSPVFTPFSHAKEKVLNQFLFERCYKAIKNQKIDIIHTNTSIEYLGAYLAKKMNVPHVWHCREYGKLDYNTAFMYSKKYVSAQFESAAAVIAISNSIAEYYRKKIFLGENIHVIYNGVDNTFSIDHFSSSDGIINFCCVGVLRETKNQLEILKAVKVLKNISNIPFVVHFLGSGHEQYIKEMEKYISSYGLEKYVKMWGYRKDVQKILKKMQVGIVPSLNEAFGRVTVEFMMEKMPVIGANTGGTVELISNNIDGYLYQVGDYEDLARYMEKYLQNPNLIIEHGQNGYEKASVEFKKQKNTDMIKKLYDFVLKGGKGNDV